MSELQKMVAKSIQILKDFRPENENYYVCYSGGKDSDCIRILCELAGVKLYPKIKANYIRAFDRMIKTSLYLYPTWKTGFDVFQWWLGEMPGQMSFFDDELGGAFDG